MSHNNIEQLANGIFLVTAGDHNGSTVIEPESLPERVWTGDTMDCVDYYERHAACPKCGGREVLQTCVGMLRDHDLNHAQCSCGWCGVVHDLVPAGSVSDGRVSRAE